MSLQCGCEGAEIYAENPRRHYYILAGQKGPQAGLFLNLPHLGQFLLTGCIKSALNTLPIQQTG